MSQPGYGAGYYGGSDQGRSHGQRRQDHEPNYRSWRDRQMESFDRDYEDYRREHQTRFDSEFRTWREGRQGQRELLGKVKEHQEVVGSDGQHIGTVDHVRGDQIELTKSDKDAGGRHHLIPASWITAVDDKVTVGKTADQAKQHWNDEARDAGGGDDRNRTLNPELLRHLLTAIATMASLGLGLPAGPSPYPNANLEPDEISFARSCRVEIEQLRQGAIQGSYRGNLLCAHILRYAIPTRDERRRVGLNAAGF